MTNVSKCISVALVVLMLSHVGCEREPAPPSVQGGHDATEGDGFQFQPNLPETGPQKLAKDPRLKRVYEGFKHVTTGLMRDEIDRAAGEPGRLISNAMVLRVGSGSMGVTIEKGKVTGFWSSGGDHHAFGKSIEMEMTESEARAALGDAPVATCPVYEWGQHEPPFRVSFHEGKAFNVSKPDLEPSYFDQFR